MKYLWFIAILLCSHAYAEQSEQSQAKKGYSPTANEVKLVDWMLKEDAESFANGGSSLMEEDLVSAPVGAVAKLYEDNQVAGDQKYFHKTLYVSGSISSINSGIGNRPSISMVGPGLLSRPAVVFAVPNIDKIAKLKKGQKLLAVCNGGGVVMGSPIFDSCVFADDYAQDKSSALKGEIMAFLGGAPASNAGIEFLSVSVVAYARLLPESSSCYGNGASCKKDLLAIQKSKKFEPELKSVVLDLKSAGLEFKKLKEATEKQDKKN